MTVEPENKTVHFNQLDGLRGVAIIIVVLSHCDILNQGGVANALFFAIAGFLLINPFKDEYEYYKDKDKYFEKHRAELDEYRHKEN